VTTRAHIALGANLGDRAGTLARAIEALRETPGVRVIAVSHCWETAPVGPPQPTYLNAAAALDCELDAPSLLARLHEIERDAGRTRGAERNLPRTLDLDLLLFGGLVIEAAELVIPHPRMHERAFVLAPLLEIAPACVIPGLGPAADSLARCTDQALVRLAAP
jgi:2-amino-4-hydroxy-6-hydroxymethyldihydropteridine diphosphokinase